MNLYKVIFKSGVEEYYQVVDADDLIQVYISCVKDGSPSFSRKVDNKYMFIIKVEDVSSIILIGRNVDAGKK